MPSTRLHSKTKISAESTRTAIIVSVVIGVFATIALVGLLWSRRIRRSARVGSRIGSQGRGADLGYQRRDYKDMETGVIQEPLPVYQKARPEDERRLVITEGHERPVPRP